MENNVYVLDCTLRDGGRIVDCAFSDKEIKNIAYRLADANINIIEVGFLRDGRKVNYSGNSTFFTDASQIKPFINRAADCSYVAFVDYGMFDFDTLTPYDGESIDGIRVGFTKKDWKNSLEDIERCLNIVKDRGYRLFIQGVNSLSYSDKEILELVEMINKVHPYSFGIVDTYGAMYSDDLDRIYRLIDNNMEKDICIDFHSHNNYQLSFSLAQEIIRLSRGNRKIIIDATLNGMGKCAGNLNTELIIDYLVRKLNYNYDFDEILDIIDDCIYPYKKENDWGYSIPALMAGIYQAHPNNILYLTRKFRMQTKDIKNILSMIESDKRTRYDYDNIENLYRKYNASKIDDSETVQRLKNEIRSREILVLVPGNSLKEYSGRIKQYIEKNNPLCISVNYISEYSKYVFWGNSKRYAMYKDERNYVENIVTSNIKPDNEKDYWVNYYSLINCEYKNFENSTIMVLNLLKRIGANKITVAGFDGFEEKSDSNYVDDSFQKERHIENYSELNAELSDMFEKYYETMKNTCQISMLTPSLYDSILK